MAPRESPAALTIALRLVSLAVAFVLTSAACRGGEPPPALPASVRADYAVFAQRCSKCHSLDRPLNRGVVDDESWEAYVARMRRQPSSGISPEDARKILRYLHYYSAEERRKKEDGGENGLALTPAPLQHQHPASSAR
jgi:hypothetical protein